MAWTSLASRIALRRGSSSNWITLCNVGLVAEADFILGEINYCEECEWTTKVDAEMLCVARARNDEYFAEQTSLAAEAVQAQAECDTLVNRIIELEVDAATRKRELGVIV